MQYITIGLDTFRCDSIQILHNAIQLDSIRYNRISSCLICSVPNIRGKCRKTKNNTKLIKVFKGNKTSPCDKRNELLKINEIVRFGCVCRIPTYTKCAKFPQRPSSVIPNMFQATCAVLLNPQVFF